MYRPAPSVPTDRRQNRWGHHRRRPEIRAQPLDGTGLRLHHREEGAYTLQRVFPLLNRGKFHPKEPHAKRPHDEACQLPCGTGQGVCAGAGAGDSVHSHGNCQIQTGSILHLCQRQAQIPAGGGLYSHAQHGTSHRRVTWSAQQRYRLGTPSPAPGAGSERGLAQGWLAS